MPPGTGDGMVGHVVGFCMRQKLVVALLTLLLIGWGVLCAPFDWDIGLVQRTPVPVDAIPDIGENQQIVFTEWPGRSPQDVEDQITYPLTVALLGIPGVETVRSGSMFGFSSVYVIFKEDVEFYWSRSRVLEKLASLPQGTLPQGVQPTLGPDATALGQVFWYTLEGRDPQGNATGGWDLDELRSIQDFFVRYGLLAAEGVAEVASAGGFVREYQVDVDPEAMRAAGVSFSQVIEAVRSSNLDVGARTIDVNNVEYIVRGVGFVQGRDDIAQAVIAVRDNLPVRVGDVARVEEGPALRRGVLDKGGAEVVGGVVVVRHGQNPLSTIENVKRRIDDIAPGLPQKTLADGTVSKLTIVPFYDRSGLIGETLATLRNALTQQVLVTVLVILLALSQLGRSPIGISLLVSAMLPLSILGCFVLMRYTGVSANIVALSGIAIAIGTMVDMGIVITENILARLEESGEEPRPALVYEATTEVGGAVLTAVATTVVSFLPVFAMTGPEGRLFTPLAYTKTFALIASVALTLTVLPMLAGLAFGSRSGRMLLRLLWPGLLVSAGVGVAMSGLLPGWFGVAIVLVGLLGAARILPLARLHPRLPLAVRVAEVAVAVLAVGWLLAGEWLPLGPQRSMLANVAFVTVCIGGVMALFFGFLRAYPRMLSACLRHKAAFLTLPAALVLLGATIWLGLPTLTGWLPDAIKRTGAYSAAAHAFPGLGREFMPSLDEGAYLYMPTTMPHASIGEVHDILRKQDMAINVIPEVREAVGKLGRADTPLDPAPVSMIETVINYHDEFLRAEDGTLPTFAFDPDAIDYVRGPDATPLEAPDGLPYLTYGQYARNADGTLVADPDGRPFRRWRVALDPDLNPGRDPWQGVQSPDDIWDAIVQAADVPGVTSAPNLQPIAARIVMLQSGMRAPMGIKVKGPDLESIEAVSLELEQILKQVPTVQPAAVLADRIVGKPYLEIVVDREAIARYGIRLARVQEVIESAIGGRALTTTVEGRERYPVRVRYQRELRDSPEAIRQILVGSPAGEQIPLEQLTHIRYVRGPQAIKSEDTFLVGYVTFDKRPGHAEVEVVEDARALVHDRIESGALTIPPGVSFEFAGSYENQVRAQQRLAVILPLALVVILIILYLQFGSLPVTLLVFSGIAVAWSGGFLMLWLYGQSWFMDVGLFGANLRELFGVGTVNLSVAVWVGFLALFGIATDDGVLMATFLQQSWRERQPESVQEVRRSVVAGATRRIRPALMTSATTILALLPVLTTTGRGANIMVPMAIPTFGGMCVAMLTVFVVPVLYCAIYERGLPHTVKAEGAKDTQAS